jgi:hypothetical protein
MDFPPPLSLELTIEQQFQLHMMKHNLDSMSETEAKELLIQAMQMLMIKDNVLRGMLR